MDANSWASRLSSASKRYHSALQSQSGMRWDEFNAEMLMGFEELDMQDDIREEYPCPFCAGYFDIVELCCHIDEEHPVEAKNGVCPVCMMRVGVDMVAHITMHHGNMFKMHRKRKSRQAGLHSSHSTLSLLRRELREGNLQSLFGGSSCIASSRDAARTPVSSIDFFSMVEEYENIRLCPSADSTSAKKSTTDGTLERKMRQPTMSIKDQEEKTKQSDFVQGLLLSMMLEDCS